MKKISYLIFFAVIIAAFSNCKKLEFNLERNNPNDSSYAGSESGKIRILKYQNFVITQIFRNSVQLTNETNIKAGDIVWLSFVFENKCNHYINKPRLTISSNSPMIQIGNVPSGTYRTLRSAPSQAINNIVKEDKVAPNYTCVNVITDGSYYDGANGYYGLKITVSNTAMSGQSYPVSVTITDEVSNVWNFTIPIPIN